MRLIYLLSFTGLELAAMQQIEIPGDTASVAKSIIMQAGRAQTKSNLAALMHTLAAIEANPLLPNPELGRMTQFDLLKVKMNNFLKAPKFEGAINASSLGLIQETEKLVDEAVDFWAGSTTDAVAAQKKQKLAALITSIVSLTGNVALIGLTMYYGLGSNCTSGS